MDYAQIRLLIIQQLLADADNYSSDHTKIITLADQYVNYIINGKVNKEG
jgi:hypothetical protein